MVPKNQMRLCCYETVPVIETQRARKKFNISEDIKGHMVSTTKSLLYRDRGVLHHHNKGKNNDKTDVNKNVKKLKKCIITSRVPHSL
jgi:hypothetical protein